jgi:hypothetical protein
MIAEIIVKNNNSLEPFDFWNLSVWDLSFGIYSISKPITSSRQHSMNGSIFFSLTAIG